jgi:hypothetical protein
MDCDIFDKHGRMIPQSRDDWRTLHRAIQELEVGRGEIVTLHTIQELDEDTLPAELLAYKRACQAEERRVHALADLGGMVVAALISIGAVALIMFATEYFMGQ